MFIGKLEFRGGIHNNRDHYLDMTEEQVAKMTQDIINTIAKHTRTDAWFETVYEKRVGGKINS